MRSNAFALTALLPVAGLLSGCAMGTQGANSVVAATPAVKAIKGKAFGGQQAVANGQIVVYEYGATGYGSAGAAIATTTTDANGNFNLAYTCTDPAAPVYVLSIGGQPGLSLPNNAAIVLGAGIGTCAASETAYVTINEISTTALGFALSHFFSTGSSDQYTTDHFGAPASLTPAISRVNSVLIPALTDVQNGYPQPSTATFTNESAKIITVADILGACVNSFAPDSPSCSALFSNTSINGTAPTNTLEAAVNIALAPAQNVANLYSLVPPSGSSAFAGSLTTQPNDWTLAVSYTAPSLGLGVDPFTVTTLDIDTAGRVWFPSNIPGAAGVAYFDSGTGNFSPVFTASGLLRPEQVAIDINGEVWATDLQSPVIAGFPGASPAAPVTLSLPGTTSTAVTVQDDNSLRLAVVNTSTNEPSFAQVVGGAAYTIIPNTTPPGSQGFIGASLAGDTVGGTGVSGTGDTQPNIDDLYLNPSGQLQGVLFHPFADSGQVAFTGTDFVTALGGFGDGQDGLCDFALQACFGMENQTVRHPTGLSIDGGGNVWLSDAFFPNVQQVPLVNGSLRDSNGLAANQVYEHGNSNGDTMVFPGGIGIDNTGNVWVSNIGCNTAGCTPGAFVLSEIIGGGVPTINPVAAQVVLNSSPGVRPSVKTPVAKSK